MNDVNQVEWRTSERLIAYPDALEEMEARNTAVQAGEEEELIWFLEHPPLYTAGTSSDPTELLSSQFPVFETGRGGRHTYHGPGQRVGYIILDLKRRNADVRGFVHALEAWVIAALGEFGIDARAVEGRVGIWCDTPDGQEAKIGAIGIRIRKWVTMHGFSVNIDPDLSHFNGIIPCGISEYPVTSLKALGHKIKMAEFDSALKKTAAAFFQEIAK
ncbi:lipoyl(octanoyl) transferase LipB [Parasphingorhabdus halotolerans]|uniref:Octanoyltransferase n=1 Tax=Parasphingorhabdus halotolerans TaxID=2725558 RepID=A0A6H2DJA5_9SPHN|nr:lipoyl(octanoyl) transferase LipB [Parasphingorhabdus halotolerans]QJB68470.1 lipoyl(octanoyl) transferase LipB [Parasphingorhabdus halotolerans]